MCTWPLKTIFITLPFFTLLSRAISEYPIGSSTYGLLCISECSTCPTVCSSPPQPAPTPLPKRSSPPLLPTPPTSWMYYYPPTQPYYAYSPPPPPAPQLYYEPPTPYSPPPPPKSQVPLWGATPPPPNKYTKPVFEPTPVSNGSHDYSSPFYYFTASGSDRSFKSTAFFVPNLCISLMFCIMYHLL